MRIIATTTFLLSVSPYWLSAQEITTLPEVVVTATRTAQTVDDTLASVTVITREQLVHSQSLTLPDVLRQVAGIDIISNGGVGKVSSLFMRGTESDHVLVLIDGVKIGSPTLGVVSFHDIPIEQIERIEVVRGARSSLYGSEALGGVIQIFTRQGKGAVQHQASVGAGSYQTYQVTASSGGKIGQNGYHISVDHMDSQGFNTCKGSLNGGCFAIEPDKDGYRNTSFSTRLSHRFENGGQVEAQALHITADNQFDSTFNNETDLVQQVLSIRGETAINDQWSTSLLVGHYRDDEDNSGHIANTFFNTERKQLSWQNHIFWEAAHQFTFGYDYQRDKVDSDTLYTVTGRDNQGIFLQYQGQFAPFNLSTGLRLDDNEQFHRHTTGHIGVGYSLSQTQRLMVDYGTAFKSPTFNELYYPGYGNAELQPEKSDSIEIGLTDKQADYRWTVNAYYMQIDDLIGGFPITNINRAKVTGLEGTVQWHYADWEFGANATWLNPENKDTGQQLPRRAKQTVNLEIAHTLGAARISAHWLAQGHRYEDSANTDRLGGYGLLNLHADYSLNKHWFIRARLDNLLDKEYETARFYEMPGRNLFVSIHYQEGGKE